MENVPKPLDCKRPFREMSTPCPQEGDSSSSRGKESNLWSGLRVAGLCVGVGEYAHIGNLSNAVQDAEAVCTRLKTAPNCHAAQITNTTATSTAVELLRSVRKYVQEPGLIKDPPALFIIHYAGHGIQTKGKTVYLVPGNARADHPGDLGHECLSLDTLLLTLRQELDEPVRQEHGESKAIAFLVVLDACRVNGLDRSFNGALACEPAPESAPLKLCFRVRAPKLPATARAVGTVLLCVSSLMKGVASLPRASHFIRPLPMCRMRCRRRRPRKVLDSKPSPKISVSALGQQGRECRGEDGRRTQSCKRCCGSLN